MKKLLAAAATAVALAIPTATADAHSISGWKKVTDSHVNGLCGKGLRTCMWWTISGRYLYSSGHWRVYAVEYYETLGFAGPSSVRQCHVNKVWVEHNERIGSKPDADYCWK